MVKLIQVLIILSLLMFLIKLFIHYKIYAEDTQSSTLHRMIYEEIRLGVILPIRKKSTNLKERKMIRIGNVVAVLFYLFFASAMIMTVIRFKGN